MLDGSSRRVSFLDDRAGKSSKSLHKERSLSRRGGAEQEKTPSKKDAVKPTPKKDQKVKENVEDGWSVAK
jgi:hypothetical protein